MKKQLKGFVLGVLITAILLNPITSFAKSVLENIQVKYDNIKIVMDGKAIDPKDAKGNKVEPFIYNGTTYLPVRAVGEAIGKTVTWEDATKTVYLGAKPSSNDYSRTNPAPVGTAQTIKIETYSEKYTATLTIVESIQGEEALKMLKEANQFNDEPAEGKMWVLLKMKATITDVKDDKSIYLNRQISFKIFNNENSPYKFESAVLPKPDFSGNVYSGGTLEGYMAYMVDISDKCPKIVFGENYDGTGGIWFKITK